MQKNEYDLVIIGAGPAGLAAGLEAWNSGIKEILIVERAKEAGGILNQCIHNGFGLHHFKEELTGPEYAGRFIDMVNSTGCTVCLDTMVLNIQNGQDGSKEIQMVSPQDGFNIIKAKAVILAMGCRERARGAIGIPGTRPAGIFTAGTAQRLINMEGLMVGKRVVILGSGDIGLIMARRMTLSGAKVLACVELMPYSGGLTRNIVQCLEDYDIPLYLSHTITDIRGDRRVEQVTVARVDENRQIVPGTQIDFDCDTVLLSVGLIPENELTRNADIKIDPRTKGAFVFENRETLTPGIFACGNVVHVHDLVDYVTEEAQIAGKGAAQYIKNTPVEEKSLSPVQITVSNDIGYSVPQYVHPDCQDKITGIFFRVRKVFKENVCITVTDKVSGTVLASFKREHLAPGEMERINLVTQKIIECKGGIHIEIQNA